MVATSLSESNSLLGAVASTLPRRSTVTWSAMLSASRTLWVMKRMEYPLARRAEKTRKRPSTSWGARTLVGSSNIRSLASARRSLISSTRCLSPRDSSSTRRLGSISRSYSSENRWIRRTRSRRRINLPWLGRNRATFSATDSAGDQREVLEYHADAQPASGSRGSEAYGATVDGHRSRVGGVVAVDYLHQGALAGPVLAQHGMHLTALYHHVDAIVGDHTGEGLGDAAQFQ